MPSQEGRVFVVTGANVGLGLATCRALAARGARVVMACRRPDAGQEAAARIRGQIPRAAVEVEPLDLGDLSSVSAFATRAADRLPRLDCLVNNAGIMGVPRALTVDGFERQFAVNHLGHFALTGRLLPLLLSAPRGRVVTVTSATYLMGRIDFGDLQGERRYRRWRAYAQSKLANLLFAVELDRRCPGSGGPAAQPGRPSRVRRHRPAGEPRTASGGASPALLGLGQRPRRPGRRRGCPAHPAGCHRPCRRRGKPLWAPRAAQRARRARQGLRSGPRPRRRQAPVAGLRDPHRRPLPLLDRMGERRAPADMPASGVSRSTGRTRACPARPSHTPGRPGSPSARSHPSTPPGHRGGVTDAQTGRPSVLPPWTRQHGSVART